MSGRTRTYHPPYDSDDDGVYMAGRLVAAPRMCLIRGSHFHEFHGVHADVTHLQGRSPKPEELDRELLRPQAPEVGR